MSDKLQFKKLVIGSDHAGYPMKNDLLNYIKKTYKDVSIEDIGCSGPKDYCDYPDQAHKVCVKIQDGKCDGGVLVCGTGVGISIAANKHEGIICGLVHSEYTAEMIRKHNNANIVAIGGRTQKLEDSKKFVDKFLTTKFEGGRHEKRVKKMKMYLKKTE